MNRVLIHLLPSSLFRIRKHIFPAVSVRCRQSVHHPVDLLMTSGAQSNQILPDILMTLVPVCNVMHFQTVTVSAHLATMAINLKAGFSFFIPSISFQIFSVFHSVFLSKFIPIASYISFNIDILHLS